MYYELQQFLWVGESQGSIVPVDEILLHVGMQSPDTGNFDSSESSARKTVRSLYIYWHSTHLVVLIFHRV